MSTTSTERGPAFDLLAAYDPARGCLVVREGIGVVISSSITVAVSAGDDQVSRAGEAARAVLRSPPRIGGSDGPAAMPPLVAGAIPFTGATPAILNVPTRAVVRHPDGRAFETAPAGEEPGSDERPGSDQRPAGGLQHEAFANVQLTEVPASAEYERMVSEAIERIDTGALRKVVLARTLRVDAGRGLDPRRLLHRLRAVDPSCYVFAAPTAAGTTIVGASPELLVARHGRTVTSNPLAGSAPRSGDPVLDMANAASLERSAKDRAEHAAVVEAVVAALGPFCDGLTFPDRPELMATANVWHLSTPFRGTLREPVPDVMELLAAMHPTPAVCGTPQAVARSTISELEPFDRGCYAGPVGWMDSNGDGEWAIALRCAELRGERATLYAGAGIVAGSDPAGELDETDRKFRAFLDSLRWG